MRSVSVSVCSKSMSMDKVWNILTDIEKYPERVRFVRSVRVYETGLGARWDDTTTILWIPLTINHLITSFKKHREYSFDIRLYFGGYMSQIYELKQESRGVILKGTIRYDLGNFFLNTIFGPILDMRLRMMLESSVGFVDGEVI